MTSRLRRAAGVMLLVAGAAACHKVEEPTPPPAAPLPRALCEKAKQALEKGSERGGFEYDAQGNATVAEEAWMAMRASDREQFAKLLAFNTACQEKQPPREETVVIKNEFGRVLSQRVVETSLDLSRLFDH